MFEGVCNFVMRNSLFDMLRFKNGDGRHRSAGLLLATAGHVRPSHSLRKPQAPPLTLATN